MVFHSAILGDVELTNERKLHVIAAHPEMKPYLNKIAQILNNPEQIRISRYDKNVLLFYKYFANIKGGKYINVTLKKNKRNFILTTYLTDKVRAGEIYEPEKEPF